MNTSHTGQWRRVSATDRAQFYTVGGPLAADEAGYMRRPVDDELLTALAGGAFANIVGGPQSGKTSLLLRCAQQLREQNPKNQVALIDLSHIAGRDGYDDAARWFYGIAYRLARQLKLTLDLQSWWSDNALLGHHLRFRELFREMLTQFSSANVILLFDDIHELEYLDYGEQLLSSFRASFDARSTDPEFSRLSIVFAGNGKGQFDTKDARALPFAVAHDFTIGDVRLHGTAKLGPALGLPRHQADLVVQRIYDWAAGQPYLMQKIAAAVAAQGSDQVVAASVDRVVHALFLRAGIEDTEPHLVALQSQLLEATRSEREQTLITIGRVHKGARMLLDPRSKVHDLLCRSGVLSVTPDGFLAPHNRIYRRVFTAGWANRLLPMNWSGLIKVAAVIALLTIVPFMYREYLPNRYVAALTNNAAGLEQLGGTYRSFARWPGHRASAKRIYANRLEQFALSADDPQQLLPITTAAHQVLGDAALAGQLERAFWQRKLKSAEANEDRAAAIWAALNSIDEDSVSLRRRVTGLMGGDLTQLRGVIMADAPFDAIVYRRRDDTLITTNGASLTAWQLPQATDAAKMLVAEQSLTLSAATDRVWVSRQQVNSRGTAANLVLQLLLDHARPQDVELVVSAPSGRSATMRLGNIAASLPSGMLVRISEVEQLQSIAAERARGEWTLRLSDVRQGQQGSVLHASLGAAEQPVTPATSVQITLADPQSHAAAAVALDARAQIAIATPMPGGTRAQIWDTLSGQPLTTIAWSADARVIGFSDTLNAVLTFDGGRLLAYKLPSGEPITMPSLMMPVAQAWLSKNGRWLATYRSEAGGEIRLIDLLSDNESALFKDISEPVELALAPNGEQVASVDANHLLRIWRRGNAKPVAVFATNSAVSESEFDVSGDVLLLAGQDGSINIIKNSRANMSVPASRETSWHFSQDIETGLALLGSKQQGFRLHDVAQGRDRSSPLLGLAGSEPLTLLLHARNAVSVIAHPNQGLAYIWRPRVEALPSSSQNVSRAWLSNDARHIAFTDSRGEFFVLRDDAGARELAQIESDVSLVAHTVAPTIVRFSPHGGYVLSAEEGGLIRVRDTERGQFFDFIAKLSQSVKDAAFDRTGEVFLAVGESVYEIRDTRSGDLLQRGFRQTPIQHVSALPDADGWLILSANGELGVLSSKVNTGVAGWQKMEWAAAESSYLVRAVGKGLAVISSNLGLHLTDLTDGKQIGETISLPSRIDEAQLSEDLRHLVVRSGHWLHRLRISRAGLSLQASRLLSGQMVRYEGFAIADRKARSVSLLSGLDEPVIKTISFDYDELPPYAGTAQALQERWRVLERIIN